MNSGEQVGNVTRKDARPEYDLGDGGDLVKEEDCKEMADAKDEGGKGNSKQYDVVEAQARVEGKEESEDDIDEENKKCEQEPDVVDGSPRNSFLLIQAVILLEGQQGDGDGDGNDDKGQTCSDGVDLEDEVGFQFWPNCVCEVSAGNQPGRKHLH